jgi:TatA/E family protein of Tat protein translocase
MFGRLGPWELLLILIIALVVFGPNKLPEMGKALGRGLMEFRQATKQFTKEIEETGDVADDETENKEEN